MKKSINKKNGVMVGMCAVCLTLVSGMLVGCSAADDISSGVQVQTITPLSDQQEFDDDGIPDAEEDKDTGYFILDYDTDARQIYAATLRNLLYSNILPDGSTAEISAGQYSSFAVCDVDSDGKEELVLLYDPGVMAGEIGYIIGYDKNTGEIYIQLKRFPYFAFLRNGNLKALSSHNQTYGDMWPYSFYQYIPESDTYELAGYVHSEDQRILELIGKADQYPYEADISEAGTVYYVGTDGWGTKPMDEKDYMEWLNANEGNVEELEIPYLSFTEENIGKMERQKILD